MTRAPNEIVRVIQPAFLVDAAKRACRYETADGRPLAPGYYFALWPAGTPSAAKVHDRCVRYFGPFATAEEAALVQGCAHYLGIVGPAATAPQPPTCSARLTAAVRASYSALLQVAHPRSAPYSAAGFAARPGGTA